MRNHLRHTTLWAVCAILAAIAIASAGCAGQERRAGAILPRGTRLRAGDILLRRGTGIESRAVMMADGGSDYSHCGICVDSGGRLMVVHAVPGEPEYEGAPDKVKMERPEDFYSTLRAGKGCVLRHADPAVAARAARLAMEIWRRGTLFDDDYDDRDTTRMYCSELVSHCYLRSGCDLTGGVRHDAALPGMRFSHLIFPSDFLHCPGLNVTARFGK